MYNWLNRGYQSFIGFWKKVYNYDLSFLLMYLPVSRKKMYDRLVEINKNLDILEKYTEELDNTLQTKVDESDVDDKIEIYVNNNLDADDIKGLEKEVENIIDHYDFDTIIDDALEKVPHNIQKAIDRSVEETIEDKLNNDEWIKDAIKDALRDLLKL